MMHRCFWMAIVAAALFWTAASQPRLAQANPIQWLDSGLIEVGDVYFPARSKVSQTTMEIEGAGILRYWGFSVYAAAFYLPDGQTSGQDFLNQNIAKKLIIEYVRPIDREDIIRATIANLQQNPEVDYEALKPKYEQFFESLVSVKENDIYTAIYYPDQGTGFYLNGERKALIKGREFAGSFFGIWLSEYPIDRGLRDALLGKD